MSLSTNNIIENDDGTGPGGTNIFTNSGELEVVAGGVLALNSDTVNNAGGTIAADAGTVATPAAALTFNSTTVTGGTVNDFGVLDLTGSDKIQTGVLDNTAAFDVSGIGNEVDNEIAFTNSGTIELKPSAQLTLTGDTVNNTGGFITVDAHTAAPATTLTLGSTTVSNGTVTNNDTLDLTGNDKIQTGALDNTAALDVSGLGNEIDNETAFSNSGLIEVLAGGVLALNSDTVNNAGGTITADAGTVATPAAALTF